jgi:glycosyltransferase
MARISVITVVKNGASTICDCIQSVRTQTVPAEHFIIDGCSDDRTIAIVRQNKHSRLKFISEQDRGIYHAMNKGIQISTGDIIGILNADDVYYDHRVLERVEHSLNTKAFQTCYGDLIYVALNDMNHVRRYWHSGSFHPEKMYKGWMPPHPTFFVCREVYENCGFFNPALGSAADYELMLRLLLKYGIKPVYIPKVLVKMRVGGISNRSFRNRLAAHVMDYRAWRINGLRPYPWTLLLKPIYKIPQFFTKPPRL